MRVVVVGAFKASSQWAHAINTVKMAQGFAQLGHDVTVICRRPLSGKVSLDKLNKVYGLTESLKWSQLPNKVLSRHVGEYWFFALLALSITISIWPDFVFSRNYIFPWLSSKCRIPTIAESHAHPNNNSAPFFRLVAATYHRNFKLWVTISQRLADHYHSLGVPKEKLAVLPDAVDMHLFQRTRHLQLSPYKKDRPNVAYVGSLYDYKGIPTILEAASLLPNCRFHLVGGWSEDITRHQRRSNELRLTNVTFYGLKSHSEVPPFLWHADVLLLPPSKHHPSAVWTSPLKLGEYLASGTPVVATDILALRDWVTDEEVEFVSPDNPKALADGIRHLLFDNARAEQLRVASIKKAQDFTYERRASSILEQSKIIARK